MMEERDTVQPIAELILTVNDGAGHLDTPIDIRCIIRRQDRDMLEWELKNVLTRYAAKQQQALASALGCNCEDSGEDADEAAEDEAEKLAIGLYDKGDGGLYLEDFVVAQSQIPTIKRELDEVVARALRRQMGVRHTDSGDGRSDESAGQVAGEEPSGACDVPAVAAGREWVEPFLADLNALVDRYVGGGTHEQVTSVAHGEQP